MTCNGALGLKPEDQYFVKIYKRLSFEMRSDLYTFGLKAWE